MPGLIGRAGELAHRFLSEVVASVVTTACVAAATTACLHYTAVPEQPPRPAAMAAGLFAPAADPGAPAFLRAAAGRPATMAVALPPPRPKQQVAAMVPRPASRAVETAAAPQPAAGTPVRPASPDMALPPLPVPPPTLAQADASTPEAAAASSPGLFGSLIPGVAAAGMARHIRDFSGAVAGLMP